MKILFYILFALFMSTTFTSCTPTPLSQQVDLSPTEGEDGEIEEDDDDGGNG